MSAWVKQRQRGFTIVELLIVIVVIAILTAIAIITYNGVQQRARNAVILNDLDQLRKVLETYNAENGQYPATTNNSKTNWRAIDVYTDADCTNGSSQADWIPNIIDLPQSGQSKMSGADGKMGCYLYVSDGKEYVMSAWNMLASPQTTPFYRRLGFREFQTESSTQFYTCNSGPVGGVSGGYDSSKDYYKHSYTISNITDCNETPPNGA